MTSSLWNSHQSTLGRPVYNEYFETREYETSGVNHIIRLGLIQLRGNVLRVLQSGLCFVYSVALLSKKLDHDSANPPVLSEYQKGLLAVEE